MNLSTTQSMQQWINESYNERANEQNNQCTNEQINKQMNGLASLRNMYWTSSCPSTTLSPNAFIWAYSGAYASISPLSWPCWTRRFSASATSFGRSSDAIAVWVRVSHCWKWSRSWRNFCSSLASPKRSSRTLSCSQDGQTTFKSNIRKVSEGRLRQGRVSDKTE